MISFFYYLSLSLGTVFYIFSNIFINLKKCKLELALVIFLNIKKCRLKLQEVISENVFKKLRLYFEKVMNLVSIVMAIIIVLLFLSKIVLGCLSVIASNHD